MQLELASASLTQKRQLFFWEDSLRMAGDGTESGGLSHHGCPHLTQRSKVLEKPSDQPKVTQQLTPMPVTNMNVDVDGGHQGGLPREKPAECSGWKSDMVFCYLNFRPLGRNSLEEASESP